jgi:hypothetical protein
MTERGRWNIKYSAAQTLTATWRPHDGQARNEEKGKQFFIAQALTNLAAIWRSGGMKTGVGGGILLSVSHTSGIEKSEYRV